LTIRKNAPGKSSDFALGRVFAVEFNDGSLETKDPLDGFEQTDTKLSLEGEQRPDFLRVSPECFVAPTLSTVADTASASALTRAGEDEQRTDGKLSSDLLRKPPLLLPSSFCAAAHLRN
jgi:hypothetical protein